MAVPKRLKAIFALAEQYGWTPGKTGDGHPVLFPPKGATNEDGALIRPVVFAMTPSDRRSDRNAISSLRRMGVPVEHKGHTKKKKDR